jgi:hypothetical protein
MNAPNPPTPDPDELASALVDGLLTPQEAERARQDPTVTRRVEELQRVRAMLQSTPPPAPGAADRAVAAAMAAFDPPARHLRAIDSSVPPPARPGAARNARWLAAAAAVVVVLLVAAVGLLANSGGDSDQAEVTASADDSGKAAEEAPAAPERSNDDDESGDAFDSSAEANAGAGELAPSTLPDLGPVSDPDELRSRVAAYYGDLRSTPTMSDGTDVLGAETCAGLTTSGDPARGSALVVSRATYRDEAVVVHVYELDGKERLVATTTASCEDVVDVTYPG